MKTNIRAAIAPSWKEMIRQSSDWKKRGLKLVFTNGCFDLLHKGHLSYLEQAAHLGDRLVIGLNSDRSVRRLKGHSRPVNGQEDRAFMLAALKMVDAVVIFEDDAPADLIAQIQPHVLVKGGDYKVEEIAGADWVQQNGGEVAIIPLVPGYSSTSLIKKLNDL